MLVFLWLRVESVVHIISVACQIITLCQGYLDGVNVKNLDSWVHLAYNRPKRLMFYAVSNSNCDCSGLYLWLGLQFGVYCIVTKMSLFTRTWLLLLIFHDNKLFSFWGLGIVTATNPTFILPCIYEKITVEATMANVDFYVDRLTLNMQPAEWPATKQGSHSKLAVTQSCTMPITMIVCLEGSQLDWVM